MADMLADNFYGLQHAQENGLTPEQTKYLLTGTKIRNVYQYNEMTILNVGIGVVGETIIINNKNGKVYRTDLFDVDVGLSKRISSPGMSVNFGNIQGGKVYSPEDIDGIILGSSVGLQGCAYACIGTVRTQGGNTIYTYGIGNPQIGISGGSMEYSGVTLSRTEINKFLKK